MFSNPEYSRPEKQASDCGFGDLLDSMIRDQIVACVKSDQVRERILREPELSLDKASRMCRSAEASTLHMQNFSTEEKEVHGMRQGQRP